MDNDQYLNRFDRLNIKRYFFFLLIQRNYLKFFNIIYKYIIYYIYSWNTFNSRDNKYIKLMYKNIN